jgi:hypothetical protein
MASQMSAPPTLTRCTGFLSPADAVVVKIKIITNDNMRADEILAKNN